MLTKIKHLFEYVFSVFRIFRHTEMPPDLILFITSRCNCRCEFCHFLEQIKDGERKKQELSLHEMQKIAKEYGSLSKLSLCGGEPFMRKDVPEILQAFIDHCGVRIVDIPTNGYFTDAIMSQTRRILEANPHLVLELQLSVDGPEDVHDELRKVKGLYRRMEETIQQLDGLREEYPNLRLKMNLTYQPGNAKSAADLAEHFDVDTLFDRFQIVFPHGGDELVERIESLDYDDFYKLSRRIQLDMKMRRRMDFHSLIFRAIKIIRDQVLLDILKEGDMGKYCHAGSRILVIDDIGDVFPCEPLWHTVGNLRDFKYNTHQLLISKSMRKFEDKYLGPGKCMCTWGCVVLDRIIFTPRYYPRILFYIGYLFLFGCKGFSQETSPAK